MKHFVAKLVKSFGGLCNAAESLDDFRYRKATLRIARGSVIQPLVLLAVSQLVDGHGSDDDGSYHDVLGRVHDT